MPILIDFTTLEEISPEVDTSQIQNIFHLLLSELSNYLHRESIYKKVEFHIISHSEHKSKGFILDFGVIRTFSNSSLQLELNLDSLPNLSLLLLREAYYCFIPPIAKESVVIKICINQIVENNLEKTSLKKEVKNWHDLVRDALVNMYKKDFLYAQLDKLEKYFKIETLSEDQLDTVQHFFSYIHENPLPDYNFEEFYDIIFEDYCDKTTLFNPEIIETLRILIHIFYETKSYLSLTEYKTFFQDYKESGRINSSLSKRKFEENLDWINKCSPIAPSYDYSYSIVGFYAIFGLLEFNPLLDKSKINNIIKQWPFFYLSKTAINSFGLELSVTFHVPKVYLKDFLDYFNKLEEKGYLIRKTLLYVAHKRDFLNLNYRREQSNIQKIIDPLSDTYNNIYEIEHTIAFPQNSHYYPLNIFNFMLLERSRTVSVTGLTFDKRRETLNSIKEDVENEVRTQKSINEAFKNSLEKVKFSPKLVDDFLKFIVKKKDQGFFFYYDLLGQIVRYLELVGKVLNDNPHITTIHQVLSATGLIEDHIFLNDKELRKIISLNFLPLQVLSKHSVREAGEKVKAFYNVMDACYNLKILDLARVKQIVKKPNIAEQIYQIRKNRYNEIFRPFSEYKITNEKIESAIDEFLQHKPPVIKPWMISTIFTSVLANFYPELILEDTPEVREKIRQLQSYFPRIYIYRTSELYTEKKLLRILIYSINFKEKKLFSSIIYSFFKDSLIYCNRYFWSGQTRQSRLGVRDFYDYEKGIFLYIKNLHEEIRKYSQLTLGEIKRPKHSLENNVQELFWGEEHKMGDLMNAVNTRISHQNVNFDSRELDNLSEFIHTLEDKLLDIAQFKSIRSKEFFQQYIKSIKFIPKFQKFGFSQYCLFFRPFYYKTTELNLDFKLLFINTFQKIAYPASIKPNPPLYTTYLFPFRTPNKAYINWLIKSKNFVAEYCLFSKKKLYDIFHLDRNLTKEGWTYSHIRFKSYMEDVLFNPHYKPELLGIREFNLCNHSDIYGPDMQEYIALTDIYSTQSRDIKSYLGTRQYTLIEKTTDLLKKKLIFPYITLKNLAFQEKISLIIPDLPQKDNEKLLQIFHFFNVSRIYEIEGEYFIYGFDKEKTFENGLLVELWFPKCELDEFFKVFNLLFQYLGIIHPLILTDLVKGDILLKTVYRDLDSLKEYNPLRNLKWNEKDKIWMNHKLFNEKFEPQYPELQYDTNSYYNRHY